MGEPMTATEIEAVLRRGMCSPSRLAEGPCECCEEKLRAVEAVHAMEREVERLSSFVSARALAAAERERAAADALAAACVIDTPGGWCCVCQRTGEHALDCALAAYRAARGTP